MDWLVLLRAFATLLLVCEGLGATQRAVRESKGDAAVASFATCANIFFMFVVGLAIWK